MRAFLFLNVIRSYNMAVKTDFNDLQRAVLTSALHMKKASLVRLRTQQPSGSALHGALTRDIDEVDNLIVIIGGMA